MARTVIDLTASSRSKPQPKDDKAVYEAISKAEIERLQLVLRSVCRVSETAREMVAELLLVDARKVKTRFVEKECDENGDPVDGSSDESDGESSEYDDADDNDDEDATPPPPKLGGTKVKVSRYAYCENCKEEFDTTMNGKRDCRWHPDMKVPDYDSDIWADHDERCHGTIEDLEDEVPDGFMWQCCEREVDDEGCMVGTHVEDTCRAAKRTKR